MKVKNKVLDIYFIVSDYNQTNMCSAVFGISSKMTEMMKCVLIDSQNDN